MGADSAPFPDRWGIAARNSLIELKKTYSIASAAYSSSTLTMRRSAAEQ
jgi:hypothetical protein